MTKDARSTPVDPAPPSRVPFALGGTGDRNLSLRARIAEEASRFMNGSIEITQSDVALLMAIRAVRFGTLELTLNDGQVMKVACSEVIDFAKEGYTPRK